MATDGGSRSDREKPVALHPSSEEFLIFRGMDAETRAMFSGFSEPAKEEIRQSALDHTTKLIRTTDTCRENEDGILASPANAKEAAILIKRSEGAAGAFKKLAGILGGLLAGHGLSTLNDVIDAAIFDKEGIIIGTVSVAVGIFLITQDLPRDAWPKWPKPKSAQVRKPLKVRRRPASQASKRQEPKT